MFLFAKGKKLQNRTSAKSEQTSLEKFQIFTAWTQKRLKAFCISSIWIIYRCNMLFSSSIFVSGNLYIAVYSCKYIYEEEVTVTHKQIHLRFWKINVFSHYGDLSVIAASQRNKRKYMFLYLRSWKMNVFSHYGDLSVISPSQRI